jgi:hypothetical protein
MPSRLDRSRTPPRPRVPRWVRSPNDPPTLPRLGTHRYFYKLRFVPDNLEHLDLWVFEERTERHISEELATDAGREHIEAHLRGERALPLCHGDGDLSVWVFNDV